MSNELFAAQTSRADEPLASRMRPRTLDEYIGQERLLGAGRLLRRAIQADRLSSLILFGPPGTGKTTLARVIANHTKSTFVNINAVLAGVQKIREAVAAAEERKHLYGKRTILFVDEVHRWNRSQQDALLPWVENGTIILIGATTENPFFEVNKALVSRSRVFQLHPLTAEDLYKIAEMALADTERGYGGQSITIDAPALTHLVQTAAGDARSLLNALELAIETAEPTQNNTIHVTVSVAEESIQQKVVLYDRDGDYHYDIISAFIKSIRGSDPNAALYWLARMIAAGESPHFIFRRLLISACEDVGLAQPEAIGIVMACAQAFDRVGLPEGRFHLTHATLYLATAKKSNTALGFFDALKAVEQDSGEVPNHLKDASRDSDGLGHGAGYRYPHSYHGHWSPQHYLPDTLQTAVFYKPSKEGYEGDIRSRILMQRELQQAQAAQTVLSSIPCFSADTASSEEYTLLTSGKAITKNSRVLLYGIHSLPIIEQVSGYAVDGCTAVLCKTDTAYNAVTEYASRVEFFSRPLVQKQTVHNPAPHFGEIEFDLIIARSPAQTNAGFAQFFAACAEYCSPFTRIRFTAILPEDAPRFSDLLTSPPPAVISTLKNAEGSFFSNAENEYTNWTVETIINTAAHAGITLTYSTQTITTHRHYSRRQLEYWFSPASEYGKTLLQYGYKPASFLPLVLSLADAPIKVNITQTIFDTQSM